MRVDGSGGQRPRPHFDGDAVRHVEAGILARHLHQADEVARQALALQLRRHLRIKHDHAGIAVEGRRGDAFPGLEAHLVFTGLDALAGNVCRTIRQPGPLASLGCGKHCLHGRSESLADNARINDQHLRTER